MEAKDTQEERILTSLLFRGAFHSCSDVARPLETSDKELCSRWLWGFSQKLITWTYYQVTHAKKLPYPFAWDLLARKEVDLCAPTFFIFNPHAHGMKVSFTHNTVAVELARRASYRHIAIIEDVVVLIPRVFSRNAATAFHRLVFSNSWRIICFGFRPFFLEETSRNHCLRSCQCKLDTQVVIFTFLYYSKKALEDLSIMHSRTQMGRIWTHMRPMRDFA